ncbi:MAG: hypothetical protein ACXV8Q_19365 [Methylobacter sp.]
MAINITPHLLIMGIDQIASEAPCIVSAELSDDEATALAKQRDAEIESGEVELLSHTH